MGSAGKWACCDSPDLSSLFSLLFSPGEVPALLAGDGCCPDVFRGCQAVPAMWEQRGQGAQGDWKMRI